ncbi:P-loop containing nucleoside triphosphate hydrolase protein [Dichomitus squalens]|uniref:P-loop containing nucleoside triphosphate hydrolase protein n=1 Tax=Dichomitus squalens TaxID=114155 RepID=A0A4Q9PT42_9APHY|nr:P-loop containing nucleoside triphosphate hydrolase protein [Dichomitus squalens]
MTTQLSDPSGIPAEVNSNAVPDPPSRPQRTEIARYDLYFNQRNSRYELRKSRRPATVEKISRKKPILLVKRRIDSRGQLEGTVIEIHHEGLQALLAEINRGVKGLDLTSKTPSVSRELFFHSRAQLVERGRTLEASHQPQDQDLMDGIKAALRLIEEDLADTIKDFNLLVSKKQITYAYLWALFPPNCYVHGYDSATDQHFVAHAKASQYRYTREGNYLEIQCDIIVHDATEFGLAEYEFKIPQFSGAYSILELPVCPLDYYPDSAALREKAISRGKVYANLRMHFYQHQGIATLCVGNARLRLVTNERVMVDVESFFRYQARASFARTVDRRLNPEELSDLELMICTPVLLGFCFNTKSWGAFAIDRITEVAWSDEPFERLVLPKRHKLLIQSLVTQHASRPAGFDDIVADKGRGLVGLLCGNPGCGKTLTAEAVAEITRKPLYTVSAGELGTTPEDTDGHLRRILRLGERWDAVVLLDEADVFLQERDKTDVSRNALVSIFLRQVEYHPGILIFTTNLIQQMDPAFESRIHFCVKYADLDFASRKKVWQTFLSKAGVADTAIGERDLSHLAKHPLNGRQIKNIVSTARSIASSESSALAPSHVQTVLEVMQDWHSAKYERTWNLHPIVLGAAGVVCSLVYLRRFARW